MAELAGVLLMHAAEHERQVLRAVATSKLSGWLVAASIPVAIAEAPLKQTLTQWFIGARTLLLTAILADKDMRPRLAFDADGFVYELDAPLRAISDY
jgi:hypothetical protein